MIELGIGWPASSRKVGSGLPVLLTTIELALTRAVIGMLVAKP
jgi:hypothetical protein